MRRRRGHVVSGTGGLHGRGGEHRPAVRFGQWPREPGPVFVAEGNVGGQPQQLRLDPADAGCEVGPRDGAPAPIQRFYIQLFVYVFVKRENMLLS